MCDGGSYVSSGTDAQAQAIFAGRRPVDDLAGWSYERQELWGTLRTGGNAERVPSEQGRYHGPSPVPCATAGLRPSPPRRPSRPSPSSTPVASAQRRLVSWRSGCCGRVGRSAAVGVGRISGYLASVHRQREPHGRDHPGPARPACRRMPAILAPDRATLTYGELRALADATLASLAGQGIGRNDRVAIVLPNGPEMATAFIAVACGATTAPLESPPIARRSSTST